MSKIILNNCKFHCIIGCNEQERKNKQDIFIDVEVHCDVSKAAQSDDLNDTICYVQVHDVVSSIVNRKYKLLESLGEDIAQTILTKFPAKEVVVRIRKPDILKSRGVEWVGVEVSKKA